MGKTSKIAIQYRYGNLPENFKDLLNNADETDLRILVAIQMLADRENGVVSTDELPELLNIEKSEVAASLKFWRGAGVLELPSATKARTVKQEPTKTENAQVTANEPKQEKQSAHRGGALERSASLGHYSTVELAELMERRKMSAQFVDEAQRIMGKVFRTYDTGILMGIVDQLGFEEEAVLAILAYSVRKGKKTLRYTEQVAMGLYDDGITETYAVIDRIQRIERSGEVIAKIRAMFGASGREMTATEKKLFTTWTEKYAYDIDVIRMAYDITVDSIQKPVPKYTNSILEKWYAEGLRTAEDVKQFLEKPKTADVGAVEKSYDVEDFFEAALQRSYETLESENSEK